MKNRHNELRRVLRDFEQQASKYHDAWLSVYFVDSARVSSERPFRHPNHALMLWQYYGAVGSPESIERLAQQVPTDWGLTGAEFSAFALVESEGAALFIRMAARAGALLSDDEPGQAIAEDIKARVERSEPEQKPVWVRNSAPAPAWLRHLLDFVSRTNPARLWGSRLQLDPFAVSLSALEDFAGKNGAAKRPKKESPLATRRFKIALSFPGEKRAYVREVVDYLVAEFGHDAIFYDEFYSAELARPNLDTLLQTIYHRNSLLIVACLCAEYDQKEWCGLEWRAIRDLIKKRHDRSIMLIRFDDAEVGGSLSIDGYLDARRFSPPECAGLIAERARNLHADYPNGS